MGGGVRLGFWFFLVPRWVGVMGGGVRLGFWFFLVPRWVRWVKDSHQIWRIGSGQHREYK